MTVGVEVEVDVVDEEGTTWGVKPQNAKPWSEPTLEAYRRSPLFSAVTERGRRSDWWVYVKVEGRDNRTLAGAVLTIASLGLIPAQATSEYTMRTRIKRDGRWVATIEKHGTIRVAWHLLLLPMAPFMWRVSVERNLLSDMSRATIEDARRQGYFQSAP